MLLFIDISKRLTYTTQWRRISMDKRAKEALKHLRNIRALASKRPSPFVGMTKDEVIEELRKTRETLWEKKLGIRA